MKYLLPAALIAFTALPAAAFDRMTRPSCQNAFEKMDELMSSENRDRGLQIQFMRISPDGWCQINAGDPGFEDVEFKTFEWRADGTSLWIDQGIPPLALQLRITGMDPDEMQGEVDTNRPPVNFEVTLRQEPDAGQLIVERAVMENDAGDSLSISGVFERVFLSSPSMMQVSVGSATFKAGLVSMTLEGTHENPFGFQFDVKMRGVPQAQRDAAFDIVSRLPNGVIDDASRAELTAFAGDLPKPVGSLEVSVVSERGLGLMQIGMAAYNSVAAVLDENSTGNELDILFDGVTVFADWSPAAQMAD